MARKSESSQPTGKLDVTDLVHPVYLDVPMMVSFLAAVEGGVSFEDQSKTVEGSQDTREREGGGGIKLPSLLSVLSMDVSGRMKSSGADSMTSEITTVRRHTEASLFNALRTQLRASEAITELSSVGQLDDLQTGELVEIVGQVNGNPLQHVLDLLATFAPYLGIDLDGSKTSAAPAKSKQNKQRGNQSLRQVQPQTAAPEEEPSFGPAEIQLFQTMRADLDNASVRDLVLDGPDDVKAVLTLSREFLSATGEEYLLGGRFTVLAKVTRVLAGDELINLTRRTALGAAGPETAREIVNSFADVPDLDIDVSDPVVEVPGLQLLPLAIFT